MSKFKLSPLVSVILIVLLGVGVYFLVRPSLKKPVTEEDTTVKTEEKAPLVIDKSLAVDKKYSEPDQYASFDITYPEFKNTSAEFNKKISDLVMEAVALHKRDSQSNWQARYETKLPGDNISEFPSTKEKYSLSVSWKPVQLNGEYISFILVSSGYTGGAHGYEIMTSFNYDVKNKTEVALNDIVSGSDYLKKVSDFSRKNLEDQLRKAMAIKTKDDEQVFKESVIPMLTMGTEPDPINFSTFTFTKSSVMLYFQEYQVAPYAAGTFTVTMPR